MCRRREGIGFIEAFSIGVGGMIGGGIFAVLGLSLQLSGTAAPIAFLLAGLIALTTAYSYSKLSIRYPSEGGTIEYIVRAYGNGVFRWIKYNAASKLHSHDLSLQLCFRKLWSQLIRCI